MVAHTPWRGSGSEYRGSGQATWFRFDCDGCSSSLLHSHTSSARNRGKSFARGALPGADIVTTIVPEAGALMLREATGKAIRTTAATHPQQKSSWFAAG